ncbi:MAG: ribonuclease HII [Candidatus Nanoarchaeia archaeon]|nr:ribonuclease HII [Candidatus Nanoarchaeia archaeon]MDD5587488.1 ribonuclease HII [Candidatus Nanoarchaeia archaeon]
MTTILGIDEARKGPIIGDMVICGVLIEDYDEEKLKNLGVKDSKLLTPIQREKLFPKILKIIKKHKLVIISPQEIDSALNSQEFNLNRLEAIKTAMIINELKPDKAIIDCPSPNKESYKNYLSIFLKHKPELLLEWNAERYPAVAAASILAKVTGDERLEKLKKQYNIEFGSGYMSDERTQKFLEANHSDPKFDKIFRKSWLPYQNHKLKQRNLMDFKK